MQRSSMGRLHMQDILTEVNAFVQAYPGISKRDACLLYLRKKKLPVALSESLQEALEERAAIQSEGL